MEDQGEFENNFLEDMTPQDIQDLMGDDDDGCIAGGAQSDLEGQDEMSDLNNLLEEINIDQKATNITSNSIKSEDDDNARVLSKKDIRSEWQKSFSWDEEVTVANQ